MMTFLYGNSDFNDLLQECYLTQSSMLSGIEFLTKANIYDNKDGLFYSSFFNLSIGIERFLKIALLSEYMYTNNFQKPEVSFLKDKSHNLIKLFNSCAEIVKKYDIPIKPLDNKHQAYDLFYFLSSYATKTRYQNLDKLTNKYEKYDKHPIHSWTNISESYLRKYVKSEKIESELLKHYNKYPNATGFTYYLDFSGHPLLSVDLLMYQYIIKKSKPYILNDLIQTLRPIYRMLDKISLNCNNGPDSDLNGPVRFPYYGELFPFFYADLNLFKRVKSWINRYS